MNEKKAEHAVKPLRLATQKQKDFMEELGLDFDDDTTIEEASEMITMELEEREELEGYPFDMEFYK